MKNIDWNQVVMAILCGALGLFAAFMLYLACACCLNDLRVYQAKADAQIQAISAGKESAE